jgi:hypothetical protein
MLPDMPAVHIYQIYYSPDPLLDPGFTPLDNTVNLRPDWFEYWPMRNFLLREALDDEAFYGFLSPRFKQKTNLDAADVRAFAAQCAPDTEVILLSPSIHNSAFFLNVFEHGDSEHPGLLEAAGQFLLRTHQSRQVEDSVSDSRNTVHSNFFLAKPRFWRAWLALNEQLFQIAEDPNDPLGQVLRQPTTYRGSESVQLKIFLMERLATWILMNDLSFVARVRDPFAARSRIYKLPLAIICDALKIAYSTQGRGQYKDVFEWVRRVRRRWTQQIRIGGVLRIGGVQPFLRQLKSYWNKKV